MDPLLREQIASLRRSSDTRDQAQATILEVLVDVREQTTKTNGRVSKLEKSTEDHHSRITALEVPVRKVAILWGASISLATAAMIVLGLVAAFLQASQ